MMRVRSLDVLLILVVLFIGGTGNARVISAQGMLGQSPATGPLKVSSLNPRYFTDESGRTVYLTGSHYWENLQDLGSVFDYSAYLDLLNVMNHNFIRLWTWELPRVVEGRSTAPVIYVRTGPGTALDGGLKFGLTQFDQAYFDRLRKRVIEARDRGIYISIMLFQGFAPVSPDFWLVHPFNKHNNINNIDGDLNGDGVGRELHTLSNPDILRLQEVYVRHVIDTVNDLDNVLYEIVNEPVVDSTEWQYHLIRYIKDYELIHKPKQHPVGMTFYQGGESGGGENSSLFESPADWISPGGYTVYHDNPPAADGRKVIISDSDHIWGVGGGRVWVWKSFARGLNPIYMDPYPDRLGARAVPPPVKIPIWQSDLSARTAMGQTRRYADRMNLAAMAPRGDLCSTTYCLVNPGKEYLVYLPPGSDRAHSITVNLSEVVGTVSVEWFRPISGESQTTGSAPGGANQTFTVPFDGDDGVLYLTTGDGSTDCARPMAGKLKITQ